MFVRSWVGWIIVAFWRKKKKKCRSFSVSLGSQLSSRHSSGGFFFPSLSLSAFGSLLRPSSLAASPAEAQVNASAYSFSFKEKGGEDEERRKSAGM